IPLKKNLSGSLRSAFFHVFSHCRIFCGTSAGAGVYRDTGQISYCFHRPFGHTLLPHKEVFFSLFPDTYFSDTQNPSVPLCPLQNQASSHTPYNKAVSVPFTFTPRQTLYRQYMPKACESECCSYSLSLSTLCTSSLVPPTP